MTYGDLMKKKGSGTPYDKLIPVTIDKVKQMQEIVQDIPQDYIEFITKIGTGELGDTAYMLYDGLLEPAEIYNEVLTKFDGIFLFGDDFQGFSTGFQMKEGNIVEIDPTDMQINIIATNFNTFIRSKIEELSVLF